MALSPVQKFLAGYSETGFPILVRRHATSFLCRGSPQPTESLVTFKCHQIAWRDVQYQRSCIHGPRSRKSIFKGAFDL
jgi:hypothetical protein